jgi:hypothetical protein
LKQQELINSNLKTELASTKNLTQKKKDEGDGLLEKLKAATQTNNKLAEEHN